MDAFRNGYTAEYVAERIRQDRAEAAEHERLRAELDAAGTPVTSEMPEAAVRLSSLTHDGEDLTAEAHGTCPGRGVYFPAWNRLHAVHYCTSPGEHGHAMRGVLLGPQTADAADSISATPVAAARDRARDRARHRLRKTPWDLYACIPAAELRCSYLPPAEALAPTTGPSTSGR